MFMKSAWFWIGVFALSPCACNVALPSHADKLQLGCCPTFDAELKRLTLGMSGELSASSDERRLQRIRQVVRHEGRLALDLLAIAVQAELKQRLIGLSDTDQPFDVVVAGGGPAAAVLACNLSEGALATVRPSGSTTVKPPLRTAVVAKVLGGFWGLEGRAMRTATSEQLLPRLQSEHPIPGCPIQVSDLLNESNALYVDDGKVLTAHPHGTILGTVSALNLMLSGASLISEAEVSRLRKPRAVSDQTKTAFAWHVDIDARGPLQTSTLSLKAKEVIVVTGFGQPRLPEAFVVAHDLGVRRDGGIPVVETQLETVRRFGHASLHQAWDTVRQDFQGSTAIVGDGDGGLSMAELYLSDASDNLFAPASYPSSLSEVLLFSRHIRVKGRQLDGFRLPGRARRFAHLGAHLATGRLRVYPEATGASVNPDGSVRVHSTVQAQPSSVTVERLRLALGFESRPEATAAALLSQACEAPITLSFMGPGGERVSRPEAVSERVHCGQTRMPALHLALSGSLFEPGAQQSVLENVNGRIQSLANYVRDRTAP